LRHSEKRKKKREKGRWVVIRFNCVFFTISVGLFVMFC